MKEVVTTKLAQVKETVAKKLAGDSQIVVALVLIAVAIGLCIIFRNQIFLIMNNLFTVIGNAITSLTAGNLTPGATGGN